MCVPSAPIAKHLANVESLGSVAFLLLFFRFEPRLVAKVCDAARALAVLPHRRQQLEAGPAYAPTTYSAESDVG